MDLMADVLSVAAAARLRKANKQQSISYSQGSLASYDADLGMYQANINGVVVNSDANFSKDLETGKPVSINLGQQSAWLDGL